MIKSIVAEIKEYFEAYKKHFQTLDIKSMGREALEAFAFVLIEQLELVSKLTDTSLDDKIVDHLKEWADKINPDKKRHNPEVALEPVANEDLGLASNEDSDIIEPLGEPKSENA